jgi:hypothetical protein
VKVHCDEGVASHIGPEPCAVVREGIGEASVGDRIGQPSSREIGLFWAPTLFCKRKERLLLRVLPNWKPSLLGGGSTVASTFTAASATACTAG